MTHERDLTELAQNAASPVRLLCRYDVRSEPPGELADIVGPQLP
jgi:hypothetical protein